MGARRTLIRSEIGDGSARVRGGRGSGPFRWLCRISGNSGLMAFTARHIRAHDSAAYAS